MRAVVIAYGTSDSCSTRDRDAMTLASVSCTMSSRVMGSAILAATTLRTIGTRSTIGSSGGGTGCGTFMPTSPLPSAADHAERLDRRRRVALRGTVCRVRHGPYPIRPGVMPLPSVDDSSGRSG